MIVVHQARFPPIFMDNRTQGKSSLPGWLVGNQTIALVAVFSFLVGAVTVAVSGEVDVLGRLLLVQSGTTGCVSGCQGMTCSGSETGDSKSWCDAKAAGTCQQKCDSMNSGGSYTGGSSLETCKTGCGNMQGATADQINACKTACDTAASGGSYTGGSTYGGTTSAMKNCTYPHALLTAAPYTEVSVWCEGDYVNCKGPNGSLTRDQIKSLGGPSTCESYGGGTYGGTTGGTPADGYTTGGTTGDTNTPYKMCWQGCGCASDTDCTNDCFTRYCKPMQGGSTTTPPTSTTPNTAPTGGTGRWTCTGTNSAGQTNTILCDSPNIGCDFQGRRLIDTEVNQTVGSNPRCVQDSSGAVSGGGYQGGATTGGTSGGVQRCFVPAEWYSASQGKQWGGTLNCKPDKTDCREGSDTDPLVSGQITFKGDATSCYPSGGTAGGGSPGGGGYQGGSTNQWQCCTDSVNRNDCVTVGPNVMPAERYRYCQGAGGGGGYQGGTTTGCVPGCERMTEPQCASASGDTGRWCAAWRAESNGDGQACERLCLETEHGAPGGNQGGEGSCPAGQMRCSPPCYSGQCPMVMPYCMPIEQCKSGGTGGWGQGGVDPWAVSNVRQSLAWAEEQIQKLQAVSKQYGTAISSAEISGITGEVKNVYTCLDALQPGTDVWTCDQKVHNNINPAISALWQKVQSANNTQQINQYNQQAQYMSDAIGKAQSAGINVSVLTQMLDAFKAALAGSDMNAANQIATQFWPTFEQLKGGPGHRMGDGGGVADSCADIQRKLEQAQDPGAITDLQGYLKTCLAYAQQSATGQKFDRSKFERLQGQFEETINQQGERNACDDAKRSITDTRRMISTEAPAMIAKVAKTNPAVAEKLNGFLDQAKAILLRAEKAQAAGDCSGALDAMSEMDELGQQVDEEMGRNGITFNDTTDDIQDIYDNVNEESDVRFDDFKKRMQDKGYRTKDLSVLKQMDPAIIAEYLQFTGKGASAGGDIVKAVANADVDTLTAEQLIQTKNDLLKQIDGLKSTIAGLKAGVRSIVEQIQNYPFNSAVAGDVEALVADVSELSEKDLAAQFAALREDSQEQYVEDGIIPFEDTEFGSWYVGSVKTLVAEGVVQGEGDGRFNPTGQVNSAQLVKFVDYAFNGEERAADLDLGEVATPKMPAWAAESALRVGAVLDDNDGRSLTTILPPDAGKPVTRADVAEVLVGFIGDSLPEFDALYVKSDLTTYRDSIQEAAARLTAAGIMEGSSDATWNPGANIMRAEMVTVLDRAREYVSQQDGSAPAGEEFAATGAAADESAPSADTGDLVKSDTPPDHPAADAAQCIAEMCARFIIGSLSYNRCKEGCSPDQGSVSEGPEGDPGFPIDEGVTAQQFKVIQAILANWLTVHKKLTEPMVPPALKLQQSLSLVFNGYSTANNPLHKISLLNQLLGPEYNVLKSILIEANSGTTAQ